MEKIFEISKNLLLEISKRRKIIRDLVYDIVNVYKQNEEGEFYLPEDITGNDKYEFPKLKTKIQVELTIFPDDETETYIIDADYFYKEGVIAITIVYNPEKKINLLYDIVGELNEVIAHEIRHVDQHDNNMYEFDDEKEEETDSVKYYTQPHELDAQVYGFKRLSKLKNVSFEQVVRNWFETHGQFHGMDKEEYDYVIDQIIKHKENK
jgi:hypothetical protein